MRCLLHCRIEKETNKQSRPRWDAYCSVLSMSTLFVFLSLAYLSLAYHKSESNSADKTKKKMVVHSTKTQISLGICLLWVFMGCCTTKSLKMAVDWDWTNLGNKSIIFFHVFCWLTILFQIILFGKLCIKQLWSRSVGLSRHFVGPNMGPNCFQRSLYNFSWRCVKFTKTTFTRLKHSPQLWKGASVCVSVCTFKKISEGFEIS